MQVLQARAVEGKGAALREHQREDPQCLLHVPWKQSVGVECQQEDNTSLTSHTLCTTPIIRTILGRRGILTFHEGMVIHINH